MNLILLASRKHFFNNKTFKIEQVKKYQSKKNYEPAEETIVLYQNGDRFASITRKNFAIWKLKNKMFSGCTYDSFKHLVLWGAEEHDYYYNASLVNARSGQWSFLNGRLYFQYGNTK